MSKPRASGWQPIETAPTGYLLLYYPPILEDRYGHGGLSAMVRIERVASTPHRLPTHWMPVPPPPDMQD